MRIFERFEVDDAGIQSMLEVLDSLRRHEQEVYDDMRKSTPDKFSFSYMDSCVNCTKLESYIKVHNEYMQALFTAEQALTRWTIKSGYNYGVYITEDEGGHHYLEK